MKAIVENTPDHTFYKYNETIKWMIEKSFMHILLIITEEKTKLELAETLKRHSFMFEKYFKYEFESNHMLVRQVNLLTKDVMKDRVIFVDLKDC